MGRAIVSPVGQSATFVELFFDLVFVFGVTQIVGLLHHDLTWAGAGRSILVFWMVWWAWTQFTWALNAANTQHPFVEFATLLATALAFFMAVAIPDAYGSSSLWFAITYVLVRSVGLWLYRTVALHDADLVQAVRSFTVLSVGGLACALIGGILGGTAQLWLWGLTIVLDVVAATNAGDSASWNLHPEHFAERHGLIVIIALGESLIVAASGLAGSDFAGDVVTVAVLAVLISCGLWWTYFPIAKPAMEEGIATAQGAARSLMALHTYTLGHFPMLCGVVAYAVALEEALAHPTEPLSVTGRAAVAVGLLLFLGGTAFGIRRTTGVLPVPRLVVAVGVSACVWSVDGAAPNVSLAIAFAGVAAIASYDEWRARRLHGEPA